MEIRVIKVDSRAPDPAAIAAAADALKGGGLVIAPTETVYGVAALASDEAAVKRIYSAKGRGYHSPLPVQIASPDMLGEIAEQVTEQARCLARRFWPGPLTLVIRCKPSLPSALTAGGTTVAVRIPDHPVALALLEKVSAPLAVTSANRSGEQPATSCSEAVKALGDWVEVALDAGDSPIGVPSTVVDTTVPGCTIIREGAISIQGIMDALKEKC